MSARFRLVHFVPDPFLGARVPIAALVEHGERVSVATVSRLPDAPCLGGETAAALADVILEDLLECTPHFNELPASVGPQAILDVPFDVPDSVTDPVKWVETRLAYAAPQHSDRETAARRPSRAAIGYKFFETYAVSRYIHKTFDPTKDGRARLVAAEPFGKITHFVEGLDHLMLMEPIVPRRQSWKHDTQQVAKTFAAYKSILPHNRRQGAELVAYVLAGGTESARSEITRILHDIAHKVIDTSVSHQRAMFIRRIRETGESGSLVQ